MAARLNAELVYWQCRLHGFGLKDFTLPTPTTFWDLSLNQCLCGGNCLCSATGWRKRIRVWYSGIISHWFSSVAHLNRTNRARHFHSVSPRALSALKRTTWRGRGHEVAYTNQSNYPRYFYSANSVALNALKAWKEQHEGGVGTG